MPWENICNSLHMGLQRWSGGGTKSAWGSRVRGHPCLQHAGKALIDETRVSNQQFAIKIDSNIHSMLFLEPGWVDWATHCFDELQLRCGSLDAGQRRTHSGKCGSSSSNCVNTRHPSRDCGKAANYLWDSCLRRILLTRNFFFLQFLCCLCVFSSFCCCQCFFWIFCVPLVHT